MPTPGWDFGSMIDAIMDGEYDIIGVRQVDHVRGRFEFDPHAYPYGGIDAIRAIVRAFGHQIIRFDDGTGPIDGDPQPPRWIEGMKPLEARKPPFWDRFKPK
jgi:hypothetical protein